MTVDELKALRLKIEKEATLQMLCAHYEFGRDLDRYDLDSGKDPFGDSDPGSRDSEARSKHRIVYVFDENVFELFLKPKGFEDYVAANYTETWADGLYGEDSIRMSINAQSALIASENLFGSRLPGQDANLSIYMTEWHYRELHSRLKRIKNTLERMNEELEANDEKTQQRIAEEVRILLALEDSKTSLEAGGLEGDELLLDDAAEMRNLHVGEDVIAQVCRSRRAARIFANGGNLQLLHQYDRLLSKKIVSRLRPLHQHKQYRPRDDEERAALRRDREMWFGFLDLERTRQFEQRKTYSRLEFDYLSEYRNGLAMYMKATHDTFVPGSDNQIVEELRNLDRRIRILKRRLKRLEEAKGPSRTDGSLLSDARSMAYVLWIARTRLQDDERIVMVTGDELLFGAYRKWYAERPQSDPFVLRRVAQYAPLMKLPDALKGGAGERSQFRILVATRMAALPPRFAFALRDPSMSGREGLAWQLSDRSRLLQENPEIVGVVDHMMEGRLNERRQEIEQHRTNWQECERDAIGVFDDLVANRSEGELFELLRSGASDKSDLAKFFRSKLEALSSQGINIWFPLAKDFIGAGAWREKGFPARAPIALRLKVPGPEDSGPGARSSESDEKADDIADLVERWVGRDDEAAAQMLSVETNPSLSSNPDFLFAVAATLALRIEHWGDAERFADLAISSNSIAEEGSEYSDKHYELLYLHALALRFRLGQTAIGSAGATPALNARWQQFLNHAVAILDRCESHHRIPDADDSFQVLRTIRAISERAAIRLFYAMWVASALGNIDAKDRGWKELITPSSKALCLALMDLRACRKLDEEKASERLDRVPGSTPILFRLRRQIYVNFASSQVIADLFRGSGIALPEAFLSQDEHRALLETLTKLLGYHDFENLPKIAKADILAYRALSETNEENRETILGQLKDVVTKSSQRMPNLAIDHTAIEVIAARFQIKLGSSPA